MNHLIQFVQDHALHEEGAQTSQQELYSAYIEFCLQLMIDPLPEGEFVRYLRESGALVALETAEGLVWQNIDIYGLGVYE